MNQVSKLHNSITSSPAIPREIKSLKLCTIDIYVKKKNHYAALNPSELFIFLIWFLNIWQLNLSVWIYELNLLWLMSPVGTLKLKNSIYYFLKNWSLMYLGINLIPQWICNIPFQGLPISRKHTYSFLDIIMGSSKTLPLNLQDIVFHIHLTNDSLSSGQN